MKGSCLLFEYLQELIDSSAFSVLARETGYRVLLAGASAFVFSIIFGRWFISWVGSRKLVEQTAKGDSERLDDLHDHKANTPTMGGVIFIVAAGVATLLWAKLDSRPIMMLLAYTLGFGAIGLADDLIKLGPGKRNGLRGKTKLFFQILLGISAGCILYWDPLVVHHAGAVDPATALSVPFFKDASFSIGLFYIPLVALVLAGSSNAVNLTDGLDGLAAGISVLTGATFVVVALLAGSEQASGLFRIAHVEGGAETAVFTAALVGGCLGFLWFNCHPAKIFMGDVGSLSLGGALGLVAVLCKQELLMVLVGGVLVAETVSVFLQVTSFKLTGRRIFRCTPLHHHFEFKGWSEARVTLSFWVASALLALASVVSLRL